MHKYCGVTQNKKDHVAQICSFCLLDEVGQYKMDVDGANISENKCCCLDFCLGSEECGLNVHCFFCQEVMHTFCGVLLMSQGSLERACPFCFYANHQEQLASASVNQEEDKKIPASKKEDKKSPTKRKMTQGQKSVQTKSKTLKQMNESLVGKQIAICVRGENVIDEFVQFKEYATCINDQWYLFGNIIVEETKPSPQCTVEWESTNMKTSKFPTVSLISSIILAKELLDGQKQEEKGKIKKARLFKELHRCEKSIYEFSSDEETEDELPVDTKSRHHVPLCKLLEFPSTKTSHPEILQSNGLVWKANGSLEPPLLPSHPPSSIKKDKINLFRTPLDSFLAFVPIEFWQLYAANSNAYHEKKEEIKKGKNEKSNDATWKGITVSELLKFFGILMKMVLRPMPGRSYLDRWEEVEWHPYTKEMTKWRFKVIRSNLQMSEVVPFASVKRQDELYKVRPLLNVLKNTLGAYMVPGKDLTLDESSVSSRSSYGCNLIFYNSTKPCGKYHFRFYLVCETDTYACLRFRVHTKKGSDEGDGMPPDSETDESENEEGKSVRSLFWIWCSRGSIPKEFSTWTIITPALKFS